MATESPTASRAPRRFELDWLRVLAILAVFVFHSSRFFDTTGWHVKNPRTYFGVQVWVTFVGNWLMPVIFVISGASLFYALGSRGAGKFVLDKVKRLLVPLVVGIFTHVILQVYLENLSQGRFRGSLIQFIPRYFRGLYGYGGNFAWMGLHLWYLEVLFVFSLLLYPLFRWLRSGSGRGVLDAVSGVLALPGVVFLLGLPVGALMAALNPREFWGQRDFGGWPLVIYLLFLIYGFFITGHEGLRQRIQGQRWIALALAVASFFALLALWASRGDPAFGSPRYAQVFGIFGFGSWCWIMAFFGFASKHLTASTPFLAYANEAVLPFYILHQTVLLAIGYFVVCWRIPDLLKAVVISGSSFVFIMACYEFLIRRVNVLRVLFGMKPKPAGAA